MTDATDIWRLPSTAQPTRETVHLPQPQFFDAPVLISDCVNPLAGETLLSLIWKRLDKPDSD